MAATKVQAVNGEIGTGTSLTIGAATYTAGNSLIVLAAFDRQSTNPVFTDTTHSVAYTRRVLNTANAGNGNPAIAIFSADNITGGSTAFSMTGLNTGATAIIYEFSGLNSAGSNDVFTSGNSNTGTAHSTGTTATTAQTNELVMAGDAPLANSASAPSAVTSGFTIQTGASEHEYNDASFWTIAIALKNATAVETEACTFTWSSTTWAAAIGAFLEAAAAGSDVPVPLRGLKPNVLLRR